MDEHVDAAHSQNDSSAKTPPPVPPAVDPPQAPPAPNPEDNNGPKKMSKSEKVMVWATCVIAAGTIVSAVAIGLQWRVMVDGGTDTTAIRIAAQQQVCAAKRVASASERDAAAAEGFAASASEINTGIGNAVLKLDAQAKATQQSANAAKHSAEIANSALHISQRAYITTGVSSFGADYKSVIFEIINSGHVPSGPISILFYERSLIGVNPQNAHEFQEERKGWGEWRLPSIPPQNLTSGRLFLLPITGITTEGISSGQQSVWYAGTITYNDGFPDTPPRTESFCASTSYDDKTNATVFVPCHPDTDIPRLRQIIQPPANEYKQETNQ